MRTTVYIVSSYKNMYHSNFPWPKVKEHVITQPSNIHIIISDGFRNSGFRNYRKVFSQNFPESKFYFPEIYRKADFYYINQLFFL